MKILFTGRGTSGSFKIRAEQIGGALGARVVPMASLQDCRLADLIVVVKRVPDQLLTNIRQSGRPWVYDIVDAYPQPLCSTWGEAIAVAWLKEHLKKLQPDFVIWPNDQMRLDSRSGGEVIYHHHWPQIAVNPIRERIQTVGYEGAPAYLESMLPIIEKECAARGWRFLINPPRLADVDVVLALRCKRWNGYAQRRWKSNVKLANAHGSGTPFIGAPEDGYLETACGPEIWATEREHLARGLDALAHQETRRQIREQFLKAAFSIDHAAERYRDVLCALKF